MAAVTLIGHRLPAADAGRTQRWKDLAELEDDVQWPQGLQIERLRRDVCIERVRPDTEWKIALELRRHAVEHQAPMLLRAVSELEEQAGLADTRLTLDRHAARRPAREHAQHRIELCELGVASDDRPGKGVGAHPGASLTPIGSGFTDLGLSVAGNVPHGSIEAPRSTAVADAKIMLSEKTIESHMRNIFAKLGASSRVHVARTVERDRRERDGTPPA